MKALMVGGPRNGHMVTVSGVDADAMKDHMTWPAGDDKPRRVAADDVWPATFVDLTSGTTYRRFPLHFIEMSTLVPNHVKTRWDAVVYLHEGIRTDAQVGAAFPQAAALWWFRETGIPSNPNDPRPFEDEQPASETAPVKSGPFSATPPESKEDTPA